MRNRLWYQLIYQAYVYDKDFIKTGWNIADEIAYLSKQPVEVSRNNTAELSNDCIVILYYAHRYIQGLHDVGAVSITRQTF